MTSCHHFDSTDLDFAPIESEYMFIFGPRPNNCMTGLENGIGVVIFVHIFLCDTDRRSI